MKNRLMILVALAATLICWTAAAVPIDMRGSTTIPITCQNVSTTQTVLSANSSRALWAIWTTSGAGAIYFKGGTGAAVPPLTGASSTTGFLAGGSSFTDDGSGGNVYVGLISAVAKTGTVWVCTMEKVKS